MGKKKQKFYAIKIGNGVENIIVTTWEECKKYVLYYNSIYKSFLTEEAAKNYLENWTEEEVEKRLTQQTRMHKHKILMRKENYIK